MKFQLTPYYRDIPDDELIADLQKVVKESRKETISRVEYNKRGKFSEGTLRKRFGGWLNALERAGLQKIRTYSTNDELLNELKRIAIELKKDFVTIEDFNQFSKLSNPVTIQRRFGSWQNALNKAGLKISPNYRRKYSDEEYFENLLNVWTHYGRQPTAGEVNKSPSLIHRSGYENRFGAWRKALRAFVERMNREESVEQISDNKTTVENPITEEIIKRSVAVEDRRGIGLGLRYKVLSRDKFKCVRCGASPATDPSCRLHIDHILPFSKDGKTTLENLQTLCEKCNLGKGNRHSE